MFLEEFLGNKLSDQSAEAVRSAVVSGSHNAQPSHQHLLLVGQIIFRYQLLDIAANTLNIPHPECHSLVERKPRPAYEVKRLNKVRFIYWPQDANYMYDDSSTAVSQTGLKSSAGSAASMLQKNNHLSFRKCPPLQNTLQQMRECFMLGLQP